MPEDMARQALLRNRPEQIYALAPLAPAVFRAQPMGAGRAIVVKVGGDRALLARQFRRQRQAFRAMPDGTIPRPLFLDPDLPVMGMEAISGRSFREMWSDDTADDLAARAGAWLGKFHQTTREIRPLDTDPMLRWLGKILPPDLGTLHARIVTLAQAAQGTPTPHAIIHGDFHSGNLILAQTGRTAGFDFENTKADLCLRDVFFFLTQAKAPAPCDAFLSGYGDLQHQPATLRFLDAYLATAAAARALNTGQSGPKMRARLNLLLPIAKGQRGLLAPPTIP